MKIFTIKWMLAALVSVTPLTTWAKSHVYNSTNQEVTVYWQAAGCAGIKPTPSCERADKNVATVCKKKALAPGESSEYHFKDGTSNRQVKVFQCYNNGQNSEWDVTNTGNKGDKKRCAATYKNNFRKVQCGYSQADYDALKGN